MTDIRTKDDDIYVDEFGQSELVSGADELVQRNEQHFGLLRGEWFLNVEAGVPYKEEILGKGQTPGQIEAVLKDEILSVPGNTSLLSLSLDLVSATRKLHVSYKVLGAGLSDPVDVEVTL